MKEIYLIRHTTPAVEKGICYGQTDLDVTESFAEEAEMILRSLPSDIVMVYSSPLKRCARLAEHLFPGVPVLLRPELMELDCGSWEMCGWDSLPKEEVDPWMEDFVNVRVPGGESYIDLYGRVMGCWGEIAGDDRVGRDGAGGEGLGEDRAGGDGVAAVVAHGGVIRSILASITGTPLVDSFKAFALHYGCVVRVRPGAEPSYEVLWNRAPVEREQHKPSSFYKKFT